MFRTVNYIYILGVCDNGWSGSPRGERVVIVGSVVYHNFSIIFLYLYSKGPLFEMFLFLVIVGRWGLHQSFPEHTRIIFSCGEWVGWKSKYIFILLYLLSLKWTVLFCFVLFCTGSTLLRLD